MARVMREATADELARWDALVIANPDDGNMLQSWNWGEFKSRYGWKPHRYIYTLADGRKVAAQWLSRKVPGGVIWYCPKGPGVTTQSDLLSVVASTKAAGLSGLFWRFEPEVLEDTADKAKLRSAGLVKANRDPGSKATIVVDIRVGEEAVLASFNQTARRNIRKAIAAGVTVEPVPANPTNLEQMFELMKATESRAHYGLRPRTYFLDYWQRQVAAGQAQLFFARHEGNLLAGVFITYLGDRAWYKDGGSHDFKRELQPTYLMQWEVMRWLMARGISSYDLVGVPNRDQVGQGNSRDGLYEFKSKFNPEITEFIGCWDLVQRLKAYKLWLHLGERLAGRQASKRPEKFLY